MTVAWTALTLWPVICIVLYQKMKLPTALCVTIIGGYLLLPEGVSWDLPLLPPLNKLSITTLTAFVLTAMALGKRAPVAPVLPGWLPRSRVALSLIAMMIIGSFGTILTNGDPLFYGPVVLKGLQLYDAFSLISGLLIILIPLLLGRKVLSSPDAQRTLLVVLVISAAIYCLPSLYEVRMSPRLHIDVYGFFPHSWFQSLRGGGFRPNVFLGHGLALALFMAFAVIAAAGLFRAVQGPGRSKWAVFTAGIFGVLILCKSLGALIIAACLAPVALFCRPRTQLLIAACVSGVVLTYPTLRAADLVPVDDFLTYLEARNPERAQSFGVRVFNENILLEKARERPVFGWGQWARSRVFDEEGRDISITDGAWVIEFGTGGWIRYLSVFGLLCWPGIALFFGRRENIDPFCAILALLLAAKLIDLIPNAGMEPLAWLIAGSLLGRVEMRSTVKEGASETPQMPPDVARTRAEAAGPGHPAPATRYARSHFRKDKEAAASKEVAEPARKHAPYHRGKAGPGYRR